MRSSSLSTTSRPVMNKLSFVFISNAPLHAVLLFMFVKIKDLHFRTEMIMLLCFNASKNKEKRR